ncbi:MAG: DNA internalization-related competence protein ComEC/Rec2 [Eubacteriales bacterium]|nr:DNA internalization-related competence protein ComEC/Rec2 [Eubacteriales bacterium]
MLPIAAGILISVRRRLPAAAGPGRGQDFFRWKGRSLWLWLLPVFFMAGVLRAGWAADVCGRELALGLDGVSAAAEGRVVSRRITDRWMVLTLEKVQIKGSGNRLGRLQIYAEMPMENDADDRYADPGDRFAVGRQVRAEGECTAFDRAKNPGEFDFCIYYRSQKLNYRMFADSLEVTGGRTAWIREGLCRLSFLAGQILDRSAGEDAGVFQALMLGDKAFLPEETRALYQENGIAHLLAISGLHLSLVSLAVYGLCRRLGAGFGLAGIFGGMILTGYAALTGASPSVIRALIMALCGFAASYLGRTYDLLSALALSGLWILWDSPYLMCQAGVQLSFGALAGIGAAAPRLGEAGAGDAQNVSIGMQLTTLPLVLYHFFQYPLYGIFLNLITVPLMGIVVASGSACILLGALEAAVSAMGAAGLKTGMLLAASGFAAGSGRMILRWYERCCHAAGGLPGSVMILGRPEHWQLGLYYGLLTAALCCRPPEGGDWRRRAGLCLILLVLLPLPVRGLEVTFLDVGQGDGICIRAEGQTILVDGGSTDQKQLGKNRLEPFLKSRGIRQVDYAVVSHGDQDHISGLLYLLEEDTGILVKNLILPGAGWGDPAYGPLKHAAAARGCTLLWMEQGSRLVLGRLEMSCLYPPSRERAPEDRNEQSLVIRLAYGGFTMMLTGDMSAEGEAEVLKQEQEPVMVLKIAHHGSRYSTSEPWLEALEPEWAVISYGEDNRYGHPHQEVTERLQERGTVLWETAKDGAVIVRTDGRQVRWETWAGQKNK